jgi:hypothetical protein
MTSVGSFWGHKGLFEGVKQRKTQREQMSSGLPLIADIDGFSDVRDRQQNIDALSIRHQIIVAAQNALDVECGASCGVGIGNARGQHT